MSTADPRIAFFDHHAATWDIEGSATPERLARLAGMRTQLGLKPGRDLFEVGCGTGRVTSWLIECVAPGRVTGIDFSPKMLAKAQARGLDADFRQLDVCSDALGDAEVDLVFCMDAFPHFRDQRAAVRNFARALRPGGRLVVLHLDGWRNINAFHDGVGPPVAGDHIPEPAAWGGLLADAGLRLIEIVDREDVFLITAER